MRARARKLAGRRASIAALGEPVKRWQLRGRQPERNESLSGMADQPLTLFTKLFAAGFYGLSSFLIVVVNKSVLTNYR